MIIENRQFGSPFKNRDAGLITSNDEQNNSNCRKIIDEFLNKE